jgi:hypothetical protein
MAYLLTLSCSKVQKVISAEASDEKTPVEKLKDLLFFIFDVPKPASQCWVMQPLR